MDNTISRKLRLTPNSAAEFIAAESSRLVARLGRRCLIGITGGPGVGKSTISAILLEILNTIRPGCASLVPMDGFHMRQSKLDRLGIGALKGTPATFEVAAFAAFLRQIKSASEDVFGPAYSRKIEDVVENGVIVSGVSDIIIVEGNYLLLQEPPWSAIGAMIDQSFYLDVPRLLVRDRLIRRRMEEGLFSLEDSIRHVDSVDMQNLDLTARSRGSADFFIGIDCMA